MKFHTPFRIAHEVAGECVRVCEGQQKELWDLTDDELTAINPALTPAVREVLSVPGSLGSRNAQGGTAPERVAEQREAAKVVAGQARAWAGQTIVAV